MLKKSFTKVWSYCYCFILFPIFLIIILTTIYLVFSSYHQTNQVLFNYQLVRISSDSMEPNFRRGQVVAISKEENLNVGDVIAFNHNSSIWFHRIESKTVLNDITYYQTKGDANILSDNFTVAHQAIIGVYRNSLLLQFFTFLPSSTGIICFVVIPCGLLFAHETIQLIILIKKKEEEESEELTDITSNQLETISEKKTTVKRKPVCLSVVLSQLENIKKKKKITASMILKIANRLERLKKDQLYQNVSSQYALIISSLNWCYQELGGIKYQNEEKENK